MNPVSLTQEKHSPTLTAQTFGLLGLTVLLTQLPLLFHLPLHLTLPGMLLVLGRLSPAVTKRLIFPAALMTPLVLLSALAVMLHYGNFFARDPCVVFLFLLVNFKFIETKRKNDASLVIVLCAFLLLTQFFYWQTIAAAMLAIPSIFMIGLALFSLQRGSTSMSLRDMVHVTSRLFLQAMPIAALLFVAVPRLPATGYGTGDHENGVTGLSSSMSPGSVSNLTKSSAVAFRVDFNGQPPNALELYWRGPVFNGFDGEKWFISNKSSKHYELPGAAATTDSVNQRLISYSITVEPTMNPWLLALDTPHSPPVSINNDGQSKVIGHINHERQIDTSRRHAGAYRYSISSVLTDRFTPSIEPTKESLFTANTNPRTREHIHSLRQKYPGDEELANRILQWFNQEPFHYTLRPQKLGSNEIDEFLFSTRRGFCEHYAGSFVFMLRAAGIPARVVTGYQGGEMNGNYMIVRQSDAHAWAEAFINGQWRRYDPTAAVARERVEAGFDAALGDELDGLLYQLSRQPVVKTLRLKWDDINYRWQTWVIDFDTQTQHSFWKKLGLEKPRGWQIAVLLAVAAGIWALFIVLPGSMAQRSKTDPCEKQWQRLQRKFSAQGITQEKHETTASYIDRLSEQWPHLALPLRRLLDAYQQGRFSKAGQDQKTKSRFALEMKAILRGIGKVNR